MEETTVSEKSCSWKDLGLSPVLCETCEKLGFTKPTNIQLEAIPWALKGRDVIGLAQTGSGKTASFVLPILDGLLTGGSERRVGNAPFALILAPTRELAVQIQEQVEALGSDIGIKSACLVGGMDMVSQAIVLARRPHIIIGTPGRLVDHLQNTKGFSIRGCRFLVLDEADRLLTMDFEEEIDRILAALGNTNTSSNSAAEGETNNASSKTTKRRQTMLFSATMTSKVAKLQRASLCDPVRIQVSSSKYSTVETLLQSYMFVPSKFKDCYLVYLANELSANSIIIFVTTCMGAQRLALLLRNLGFQAIPLHGQMSQPKRLGSLNQFKSGERSILIATDVASRGLDIPHVDVVINYDIPNHSKDYIHRVGRTARAGRSGKSITMVTQYDVELYQRIETLIGRKMDPYPANKDAVMLLHDRVSESQRLATLAIRDDPSMQKLKKRSLNDDNESDPKSLITKHAKKIKKNHR